VRLYSLPAVEAVVAAASGVLSGPEYPLHAVLDLRVDQTVEIRVEYSTSVAITIPPMSTKPHVRLGVAEPDDQVARAAALAADCDIALVLTGRLSGEAMDLESCLLPANQQPVVAAVAAANPHTVLVTLGAGPVVLPQIGDLGAVLHAWFRVKSSHPRSSMC
jgi:beta-glucosidase